MEELKLLPVCIQVASLTSDGVTTHARGCSGFNVTTCNQAAMDESCMDVGGGSEVRAISGLPFVRYSEPFQ